MVFKLKWDRKEKDFMYFLDMIPDGGTVLDIGANIGVMSVHLAKKLKNSKIEAFEPIPLNYLTLKRVIKKFHLENVNIHTCALGDKCGVAEMVMPKVKSVRMQGLSHVTEHSIAQLERGERFEVPLRRLDDMELYIEKRKITAIKIDVENYEYYVFKGGKRLIKENRPIVYCELWDNENRSKCFDFFAELDYSVYVIHYGRMSVFNKTVHQTQNFFFLPNP